MKPVKRLGVLKYRFYYYSDMVRPTGQETIATEKRVYYTHSSPKKGMSHIVRGPRGEEPVSGQRQREGKLWARALLWFREERARQGEQAQDEPV